MRDKIEALIRKQKVKIHISGFGELKQVGGVIHQSFSFADDQGNVVGNIQGKESDLLNLAKKFITESQPTKRKKG